MTNAELKAIMAEDCRGLDTQKEYVMGDYIVDGDVVNDWHDRILYIVPYTTYGDYVGSSVERSNAEYIEKDYQLLIDLGIVYVWRSDYASAMVGIRPEWCAIVEPEQIEPVHEQWTDFIETVNALHDYPVICDDTLSELEHTMRNMEVETIVGELDNPALYDLDKLRYKLYEFLSKCTCMAYSVDYSGSEAEEIVKECMLDLEDILWGFEDKDSEKTVKTVISFLQDCNTDAELITSDTTIYTIADILNNVLPDHEKEMLKDLLK